MLRKGHENDLYKAPTIVESKSERLRGEGDQIKFIDLRFERWQVAGNQISNQLAWKTAPFAEVDIITLYKPTLTQLRRTRLRCFSFAVRGSSRIE